MKVLQMSAYFEPEVIASSHLTKDLFTAFSKHGIEVEDYVPMPCRGIDRKTRAEYKKRKDETLYNGSYHVHRFSMFAEGKNPLLRAIRYVLVNLIQYYKGSRAKDIDVIFAASTPPTQGLLCGFVKKRLSKKEKREIPFVFNLQDIFPDSLVNAGLTHKGSLLWKIGRRMENYIYRNSDKIIVISEDFKKNIMEKGVPESKIVVAPNWVDEMSVHRVERKDNLLFDEFNLNRDHFYVSYCGNIGLTQNMELLIKGAEKLKEYSDIEFVIVGEGAYRDEMEHIISSENLKNIKIYSFQPYERISEVFSIGNAGLIISKPGIGSNSVPSKTWSYMAAQTPILASFDEDSELVKIVRDNECGICVSPNDVNSFVNAIISLKCGENKFGENGRRYIIDHLSKKVGTGRYLKLIRSLVNKQ